mmetsp:Transcript_60507/g.169585  ORF Transcript_60507/g.169585 Transcript_60507/m.169585 type:complete len:151 (+) Transcript_60507:127-579(+)
MARFGAAFALAVIAAVWPGASAACPPLPSSSVVLEGPPPSGSFSDPVVPAEDAPIHAVLQGAGAEVQLCKYIAKTEGAEVAASAECSMTVCYYAKQVVAGTIYRVVVSVSDDVGSPHYEIEVFEPLPYLEEKPSVRGIKELGGDRRLQMV